MIYPYPDSLTWPEHSGLYDPRLDFPALGVLIYCLTRYPLETAVTIRQLSSDTGCPYKRVQRSLRRLKETGYAVRRVRRSARGHISSPYFDIYSVPEPIYRQAVLGIPTAAETAISGISVHTEQLCPPCNELRNGHIGHFGEQDEASLDSDTYENTADRNGHIGRIYSFSSFIDLEREKEGNRNGHIGHFGAACPYDPAWPCAHYQLAMRRILEVIHTTYPHYDSTDTYVHEQVWDTIHLPDFNLDAVALIYRHLVSTFVEQQREGKKPDFKWLAPNRTLSKRTRDGSLRDARQWAAQEQARRQAKAHRDRAAVPEPLEARDHMEPDEWQAIKAEYDREVNEGAKAARKKAEAQRQRRKGDHA